MCISKIMDKYVYQITGALEDRHGKFKGLRVLVCNLDYFDSVDVPAEVLDDDMVKYLEYRLKLYERLEIQKLPIIIQNQIRVPLGYWLDSWVLENFYGDISKRKSTNP